MPRRRSQEPPKYPVMVASAAHVDLATEVPGKLSPGAERIGSALPWQKEAWDWRGALGEVWFAGTWFGNALSQVGWTVATGEERHPVRDEKGSLREGLDPRAVEVAEDAMARLTGEVGGQGEWARQVGELLTVPAEAWLIGYHVDAKGKPVERTHADALRERWEAVSPTELERKEVLEDGERRIRLAVQRSVMGDRKVELPKDAVAVRMWRADPRYPDDPTGPMQALLGTCELLHIFHQAMKGSALNRLHAGILAFSSKAVQDMTSKKVLDPDGNPVPGAPENELLNKLVQGMTTPRTKPDSASWMVPTVLTLDTEAGDVPASVDSLVKWMFPEFADDAAVISRIELEVKRLATGLDVPPEVLLGIGGLNHWSAWLVSEDAFRQHVQPMCTLVADCLTVGYLWPAMVAANVAAEQYLRIRVGFDAGRLIVHPDRSKDAEALFDRGGLSWAGLRKAKRFDEDDAPSDEELERRYELGFTARPKGTAPAGAETTDPGPAQSPSPAARLEVVRAAPRRAGVANLGRRLAALEVNHMRDTLLLADGAVNEALRLAGTRLKSRAQKSARYKVHVNGVDARRVAAALGPQRVMQLAHEDDGDAGLEALFAGAFTGLASSYHDLTLAAQLAWREIIARASGVGFTAVELERMAADAIASRGVLEAAVRKVVEDRLLSADAHQVLDGERTPGVSIPATVARRASARAGGYNVAGSPDKMDGWEGGLASGPTTADLARDHGLSQEGVEWVYGDAIREHPFEPHEDLDGTAFTGPDDPELDGCPWGLCYPGDHLGCLCTWAITYTLAEAA